jgi:uncharacterized protein YaeQ
MAAAMAAGTTIHHLVLAVSDVDRSVYETLDLRVARHPSETMRWLLTRTIAYALSYEDGIAFSKGGLSDVEEPPLSVHDRTGKLLSWIEVGAPSADRLHKASKASPRVTLFTTADLGNLRKDVAGRKVHRVEEIEVFEIDVKLVDELEKVVGRRTELSLSRNDGQLYIDVGGKTLEGAVARTSLV